MYRKLYPPFVVVVTSLTATVYRWFLFAVSPCPHRLLQPTSGFCSRCHKWFLFTVSPCPHCLLQPTGGFCSLCLRVLIACYNLQVISVCRVSVSSSLATTYRWFLFAVSPCPHPTPQSIGGFCLPCLHVLIARYNLQVVSVQCVCPHHFPQPTGGFCSVCLHHSNHISVLRVCLYLVCSLPITVRKIWHKIVRVAFRK